MALKTYEAKAIIEVDYLTHSTPEVAMRAFERWIQSASQVSLGVKVVLSPEFLVKEKPLDAEIKVIN